MKVGLNLLILLLFSACSLQIKRGIAAFASDLVGIEATFTNDFFINHSDKNPNELSDYVNAMAREIHNLCSDCQVKEGDERVIHFTDGFQVTVERDTRVVEIVATPIPVEDLHVHKKKIDLLIQAAHNVGLRPAQNTGGGHLHFDFHKLFGGSNQLLRDFLVDSYNHSFLFNSYFGGNTLNAPTIDQLPES